MMFKTVVILFISVVFLLLLYQVYTGMRIPRSAKPVTHTEESHTQRRSTNAAAKKHSWSAASDRVLPKSSSQTVTEVRRASLAEASLAERIEAIGGQIGDPVFIRIFKEEAELELWMQHGGRYHLIQTYPICAYSGDLGPKLREGDKQSPEGFYYVTKSRLNPNSRFHLSFNLGYPNHYDRAHGRTGSFLMVHGDCVSIGCYAMTDAKIEEIYELVEQALSHGQKIVRVHAFPFRMTASNMQRHRGEKWYGFWENLKEGYDWFERYHYPPNVTVKQKKYRFD